MHPFQSFDFSQTPKQTVLDDILQAKLELVNLSNHNNGRFIPLPAQTGIGKTHAACALMLERLLLNIKLELDDNNVKPALTYYITNSTDNVQNAVASLQRLIEQQMINEKARFSIEQQAYLKSQIIHLHAQGNQLLKLSSEDRLNILQAYKLDGCSDISSDFCELDSLVIAAKNNRVVEKRMQDFAYKTYQKLLLLMRQSAIKNNILLDESQQKAVYALLPGEKVVRNKACILFMTTKKFMYGYHTVKSRIDPIEHLNGNLLIIDEVDRQNSEILDVLTSDKSIDLIEFSKQLSANLSHHLLENSPRYVGVEKIIEPIRLRIMEHAKNWHTKYHFMIIGSTFDKNPIRLFSDRSITHAHSAMHNLRIEVDHDRQKNIVFSEDENNFIENNITGELSRFVNETDWIFRDFIRLFQWGAQRITKNEDGLQENPVAQQNQYLSAMASLLSHFGLTNYKSIVLNSFNTRFSKLLNQSSIRSVKRSYHDSGLKLTNVTRIPDAEDTIACLYNSLPLTPTGLLAQIVDAGANVLGISATANVDTVIHNFDHNYLRVRLQDRYCVLSNEQRKQLGDYYGTRRQYCAAGVAIKCQLIRINKPLVAEVIESHEGQPPRDLALALNSLIKISSDNDFAVEWFSKLLSAMDIFACHSPSRYMVALLSRSANFHPDFVDTLQLFLSEKARRPVKIMAGMNADAIRSGRYEEALQHLSNTFDKVIIVSTYQTMAEGKNPDYLVKQTADKDSLFWVGAGNAQGEYRGDIDTIYLEKPTNMLLSGDDVQSSLLVMLHQIMSLMHAGSISPAQAYHWAKDLISGSQHLENIERYNKTDDSPEATRRVIQQAIGRMARTAYKRSEILVMSDSSLASIIGSDNRDNDILSHEYAALRDFCKNQLSGQNVDVLKGVQLRQHNLAQLYTLATLAKIDELLRGIFKGNQNSIADWHDLRHQVLRQPTRPEISVDYPQLYLQAPEVPYVYSGCLDAGSELASRERREIKLFSYVNTPRYVGENECQLPLIMRNPVIRQHFIANHFATYWIGNPWVMTPGAYQNIYKAALGEEGVKALLVAMGFTVEELPDEVFERFDFIVTNKQNLRIAVDAKHWVSSGEAYLHEQKVEIIKTHCNVHHFAIINLIGNVSSKVEFVDDHLRPVRNGSFSTLIIPGLIDSQTGETLEEHLAELLTWKGVLG